MKMGYLRRILKQEGWISRSGKGSHEKWYDPSDSSRRITLSYPDGANAPKYILCRVSKLLDRKL